MNRIFLIGFMGSGKSTLGRQLAQTMQYTFLETDKIIEQQEQLCIHDIFKTKGESYFRQRENQLLNHLQLVYDAVIATGGGMPCNKNNMDLMNKLGTTIWLNVDENILADRLKHDKTLRPKLMESSNINETIHDLLAERLVFYKKAKIEIKNPSLQDLIHHCKVQANHDL